ncbi:hypothetical protein [Actibacterium sp. XHP0104]|uniref:hypothetical protein n=1 Tax=Actibacterium sp. XHP0104 TaxID=2984335 RepID=UPI0021E9649E|nr:hypothetical protein [Actibacterium sp. XHP0104]MCV2881519.1 hypothetical protein [Actibacterium sp. XHP0104]
MKPLVSLSICAALTVPLPAGATISDLFCDDTARLEQQLLRAQGATRVGQGMRGPDALLTVWITPSNGEWTLVQNYANGTSCVVAMGENWQAVDPPQDPA